MAFHCGAPTRDGSPCQRRVRELGIRCPQHRNLGGTALHPPRHAMRTIYLADPALTGPTTAWATTRTTDPRDRVTQPTKHESDTTDAGSLTAKSGDEARTPSALQSHLDQERSQRGRPGGEERADVDDAGESEPNRDPAREPTREPEPKANLVAEPALESEPRGRLAPEPAGEPEPSGKLAPESVRGPEPRHNLAPEPVRRPEHEPVREAELAQGDSEQPQPEAKHIQVKQAPTWREPAHTGREAMPAREPEGDSVRQPEHRRAPEHEHERTHVEAEREREPAPERAGEPMGRPEPTPKRKHERAHVEAEREREPAPERAGEPMGRPDQEPEPEHEHEWAQIERESGPGRAGDFVGGLGQGLEAAAEDKPALPRRTPRGDRARVGRNGVGEGAGVRGGEQWPLLRKERALDPDWIGARGVRDEGSTPPVPRIEFEPSDGEVPRKPPRIAPMRSVVLNPVLDMPVRADPDPPTLVDRMPPIDPDDLVVPDFLRADLGGAAGATVAEKKPRPRPAPVSVPVPDPDPPTLIDPHPPITDDIAVPAFVAPGFVPAPKPPLRTVLSTVLGPELWQRCYTEWGPAHCTALARIARAVDGLAPSAGTAVRSTAGAGMRWLGVAREREILADQVADAISHPAGATSPNQARTVRLYGAAICMALNVPLRRCACHRDLERDVSGELIRLGLEELAGEVP